MYEEVAYVVEHLMEIGNYMYTPEKMQGGGVPTTFIQHTKVNKLKDKIYETGKKIKLGKKPQGKTRIILTSNLSFIVRSNSLQM